MKAILSGDIPGFNQSKNGAINRDVCSADSMSVEPRKTTQTQISKGSQYLKKRRISFAVRLNQAPK
jgi:hypothetical protein